MVVDKFGRGVKRRLFEGTREFHDVSNKRLARVGTPEEDSDAVTKGYLDAILESIPNNEIINDIENTLKKITYFIDLDGKRLTHIGNPIAANDAVNKQYVDSKDKVTKQQIRDECEKVKKVAVAEGDIKRDIVRTELVNATRKLHEDLATLTSRCDGYGNDIKRLCEKLKINTVLTEALFHHLQLDKAIILKHGVSETGCG